MVSVAAPRVVVPSMKVTVPVGVAPVVAFTTVVKVTSEPYEEVANEEAMEVVVAAALTVCVRAAEVLVASSVSAV